MPRECAVPRLSRTSVFAARLSYWIWNNILFSHMPAEIKPIPGLSNGIERGRTETPKCVFILCYDRCLFLMSNDDSQ